MSFDHCLSLLSLQDKLPVGEIRETAKEYAAEGMDQAEAMAKAVAEHLAEAKREEANIVATVREKYVASGGKLAEPKAESPAPAEAQAEPPDDGARYSVDAAAPTFYSALERTLPDMAKVAGKDGTIKPDQARAWLQARQKEGKFKADELQWVGVDDWLATQPGRVAVADIENFVRENGVQVQEVQKGDGNADTKYSQYVLPGGENYRELLLTIPDPHRAKFNEEKKALAQSAKQDGFDAVKTGEPWYGPDEWQITDRDGEGIGKSSGATADEALAAWAMLKQGKVKGADYTSSHWDESNIVAHVRFNDRTDADGKRVLFIEELQSDWGQDGLKKGFREQQERQLDELIARRDSLTDEAERSRVQAEINALGGKAPGVAEGPFVDDTKAWLSLGIKRMIRYASENGYDRVAFVNGEQSADRYDLSKQVDEIAYNKGSQFLRVLDKDGQTIFNGKKPESELADFLGKEAADKIAAGGSFVVIQGDGLKMGGEGMKAFYDKIVPQTINEVLKKVGGGRSGNVHLVVDSPLTRPFTYEGPEKTADEITAFMQARKRDLTSSIEYQLSQVRNGMLDGLTFKQAMETRASEYVAELLGGEMRQAAPVPQAQTGFDITPELRTKALAGMPLFSVAHPMAKDAAREISPLVQALADKGAIVLHQDASTLPVKGKAPSGVQALTTSDGTIHVVANALGDNAKGVILHEAFHAGGEALVGSNAWSGLTDRLGKLYSMAEKSSGTARAFFDAARARVETARAKGAVASGMEHEEFGAYAIEEYAKAPASVRKWVDDLLGAVKAWALRRFGKQLGDVTPAQLTSLAKLALLDAQVARSADHQLQPAFSSIDQTNKPAFKRWFEGSKVVDEKDLPLVLYHGTQGDFTVFDADRIGQNFSDSEGGFFFTGNKALASAYASRRGGESGNVMPAFLSLKNPLTLEKYLWSSADTVESALTDRGYKLSDLFDEDAGGVVQYAKDGGHDGIFWKNGKDIFAVAFKPEQIKSATGNNGNFDPKNPDIRYAADSSKTIEVDGQRRPIENSRGKLIAPDMHQQMAFWRWFGDSKIVDEQNRPVVVYHGTADDIREFRPGPTKRHGHGQQMSAIYFTPLASTAEGYARTAVNAKDASADIGGAIIPAYVAVKNPAEFTDVDDFAKAKRDKLEAKGHDGAIRRNAFGDIVEIAVFRPEQVKSALGNDGGFSGDTPDIRYSVAGAPPAVAEEHRSALSKMIGVPRELLKSAAFNVRMAVVPMAAGAEQAMAMAKDFANHNRRAATQWAAFDKVLKNSYSDEQLKKMWIAADQENDLRREGRTSTTAGLASLTAGERKTVELLHAYGEQLWQKAKDAGLVGADSEGVHYWTPRMAARIVEDGSAESIRQPAGEFSKESRNLRTSASSTKQRKHETTTESEAALKAKLGEDAEYVKNIRVMPMAMAQLEKAIAGRTLVNQIRAHGKLAGDDLVSDEGRPNFVTFDHPALKQYRPKMDWQAADPALIASRGYDVRADGVYRDGEKLASYRVQDGEVQKLAPMMDSNGKPVMESFPLFVRKDFAGPLKAVFATDQGAIYNGLMSLKGGVTSMIMISPLTHNLVIWGKAMPTMMSTMGWKNNLKNAGTLGMHGYFIGNRARADHALMQELTEAGLVPVSGRGMNQDVAAIHNGIAPGRSLTAKALGSVADLASPKAGEAVRKGVDAAGHFWHETLLWDRVADLQAGMAVMMRTSLMDKGMSQDTANRIASHFANRYAGMIPREAMSEVANKIANLSLFSKSFTMTNLGAYKDLIGGLPKDVQAQIKVRTLEIQKALGKGELEAETTARAELRKVQSVTRKKAAAVLVLDVAAMAAVTSLAQALWEGQDGKQIAADFRERLAALGMKMKDDPLAVLGHPLDAISSLSQTADNPHGREDRVRVGEDEDGNSYYARLPVGKVGEELKQYGNLSTGMHLLRNKMSTFLRPIADLTANEDFTGKRIINPNDNIVKQIAAFGAYWIKSQLPVEDAVALGHVVKGDADHMDKLKLMGTATGLSVGRLSGGDAVAELRYQNREQQADLRDVLPDAREAMRRGDQEKAQQLLEDAGQTPREAQRTMRQIEQPGRISKQSLRKFNAHADEGERARLEKMRARAQ